MVKFSLEITLGALIFFSWNYVTMTTDAYTLQELAERIEFAIDLLDDSMTNSQEDKRNINSNTLEEQGGKYPMLSSGEVPVHFKCPKIPKPSNGVIRCGGTLCLVQCNDGYMQDITHAFVYQCTTEAKWKTIPTGKPIPWPDCIKETFDTFKAKLASRKM